MNSHFQLLSDVSRICRRDSSSFAADCSNRSLVISAVNYPSDSCSEPVHSPASFSEKAEPIKFGCLNIQHPKRKISPDSVGFPEQIGEKREREKCNFVSVFWMKEQSINFRNFPIQVQLKSFYLASVY